MKKRILVCLGLLLALTGCSGIFVGASVVTVGGAAVLGFECPTYVMVTVRDGSTGSELCNAPVVFDQAATSREVSACGTVGVGPGTWRIRPALPGYVGESSTLTLEPPKECEHIQYSVELTVWPVARR
jgi:hypothetical protein